MIEFFNRLFGRPSSSSTAKERLRLVLLSDHIALAPDVIAALKADLLEVISRYVDIDRDQSDISFEQHDRSVAMLANVPVLGMKPEARASSRPEELLHRSSAPVHVPGPAADAVSGGVAVLERTAVEETEGAADAAASVETTIPEPPDSAPVEEDRTTAESAVTPHSGEVAVERRTVARPSPPGATKLAPKSSAHAAAPRAAATRSPAVVAPDSGGVSVSEPDVGTDPAAVEQLALGHPVPTAARRKRKRRRVGTPASG